MKKFALALLLALPTAAYAQFSVGQLSPAPGTVVRPGQVVRIAWNVTLDDDHLTTDCEQELFLSLDGGVHNHYRLTPMMRPNTREYLWTVPDIEAKNAVLDIRFGCAESEELFTLTPWNPQVTFPIRIANKRATKGAAAETLAMPTVDRNRANAGRGEFVNVRWNSTVQAARYEVHASFDNGNRFVPIGKTQGTSFRWKAPQGTFGQVVFQIVAIRADGRRVESPISVRPQLFLYE